jgi:hypothetical protein
LIKNGTVNRTEAAVRALLASPESHGDEAKYRREIKYSLAV